MKILVLTKSGDGLPLAYHLQREGHDVTLYLQEDSPTGKGMIDVVHTLPALDRFSLCLCIGRDFCGVADKADTPLVGPSKLASKLELDRAYGMRMMEAHGIDTPPWRLFRSTREAARFAGSYGRPLVLKPNGKRAPSHLTFVAEEEDNSDLIPMLDVAKRSNPTLESEGFLLQEKVDGIEMSAGSYFNGLTFSQPVMCTFENKKLAPQPWAGPGTGEMGSHAFWAYSPKLFREVTEKMAPHLREINYRGDFDINCIITKRGPLALEMTPRVGFPAVCLQMSNYDGNFGEFLLNVANGSPAPFVTRQKWAVGVLLTAPPMPYESLLKNEDEFRGLLVRGEWTKDKYPIDVYEEDGSYYSSGTGWIGVACGTGEELGEAQESAYKRLKTLKVANALARSDIGDRFFAERAELQDGGWLS